MVIKRDCIYPPKGKNRPLHIYLPDDYEESDERYPVMYFFDGHNLFFDEDATYGKCWGLKEFLDSWDQKMIIVSVECGHEGDERLSEYLPYPAGRTTPLRKFKPLGDATMQWIIQDIKPAIDEEFRTIPFRECTGIGGSSMGGLMAVYGAVAYNQWFSKAACLSTAFEFCVRPLMNHLRQTPLDPDSRFYLSWGTREAWGFCNPNRIDRTSRTYSWNRRAAQLLRANGAQTKLYCQVGGKHCEADWEKQLPIVMDYLWK